MTDSNEVVVIPHNKASAISLFTSANDDGEAGDTTTSDAVLLLMCNTKKDPVPRRPPDHYHSCAATADAAAGNINKPISAQIKSNRKLRKSPDAPKRFKSAFIFYSSEKHKQIRMQLGDKGLSEKTSNISKLVSEAWREISPDEKQKYGIMAYNDRKRYDIEKSLYRGPWHVPKVRKPKDSNAPKRPMSAFLAFANSRRGVVKPMMPNASNGDVSRALSNMWKDATDDVRQRYIHEEYEKRQTYKLVMSEWRKKQEQQTLVLRQQRQDQALRLAQKVGSSNIAGYYYDGRRDAPRYEHNEISGGFGGGKASFTRDNPNDDNENQIESADDSGHSFSSHEAEHPMPPSNPYSNGMLHATQSAFDNDEDYQHHHHRTSISINNDPSEGFQAPYDQQCYQGPGATSFCALTNFTAAINETAFLASSESTAFPNSPQRVVGYYASSLSSLHPTINNSLGATHNTTATDDSFRDGSSSASIVIDEYANSTYDALPSQHQTGSLTLNAQGYQHYPCHFQWSHHYASIPNYHPISQPSSFCHPSHYYHHNPSLMHDADGRRYHPHHSQHEAPNQPMTNCYTPPYNSSSSSSSSLYGWWNSYNNNEL